MRCEFLPPYSPDYNPIELAFAAVKAHLRRHHHEFLAAMNSPDCTDVFLALNDAVYTITPHDALQWYRYCNYI
jgi:transposase